MNVTSGILPVGPPGLCAVLEWRSVPGLRYQVESSSDLVAWSAVAGLVDATATLTPFLVTEPAGTPYVFYRAREVGL